MGSFFSSLFGSKESPPKPEVKPDKPEPNEEERPKTPEEETQPSTEKPEEKPDEASRDDSFAVQLLNAQNVYRAEHGASPLKLSDELCKDAQKWAEYLAKEKKLKHADTDLGENLAMKYPEMTGQQAADMWYNEIKDYDFSNPGFQSGTGHFTQVVWKESKEFGAGVAQSDDGSFYAVGRYSPAGNMTNPGYFRDNVQPAK